MWNPSSDTYWRKRSTKPRRLMLQQKQDGWFVTDSRTFHLLGYFIYVNVPSRSSCLCRTLTLINKVRRRAADTDRCTAAGGKALPEKQNTLSFLPRLWQIGHMRMMRRSAGITNLAYFLEVELWQGVEPVGQLSEVEKLHLKPIFFFPPQRQAGRISRGEGTSNQFISCNDSSNVLYKIIATARESSNSGSHLLI